MMGHKWLLVKGRAGLGNRVFSLLTAVLYARLTRRRLLVDWSDASYSSDGSNVVHQFFISKLFGPSDQIPDTDSVRPQIWRGHLRESASAMAKTHAPELADDPLIWRRFSVSLSKLDYQEEVLVMWSYFPLIDQLRRHLHGEFSGLRKLDTEIILHRLMCESLELHPAIRKRVNGLKGSWAAKPVIGVHVRSTDKMTSVRVVRRKVDELCSQHPGAPIFLATDNQAVEDLFVRTYPGLLTAPKWYPSSGKALHESIECPDRALNGVEALTDLYLLAGCDYLVLDKSSSFSRLVSILADAERSQICDIYRWRFLPPQMRQMLWLTQQSVRWGPQRFLAGLRN
jgi:hypothetical protein